MDGSVDLVDVTITNGDSDGIDFSSSGSLRMRTTAVQGHGDNGVDIGSNEAGVAPSSIDLGTADDAGGSTVTGNATDQFRDDRLTGATVVVSAYGNDFGGPASGLKTGPDAEAGVWVVEGVGNQVDFGP